MKNKQTIPISLALLTLLGIAVWVSAVGGDSPDAIRILRPLQGDSLMYDQGQLLLLSVAKDQGENLSVSTQWKMSRTYEIGPEGSRENFAKVFYRLFDPSTSLQSLFYTFKKFKGYTKPETLSFNFSDAMTIRKFWQDPGFTKLVKTIQTTDASEVMLELRGWKETQLVPLYDDPESDNRWLYKIHVQMILGENKLYFLIPGAKGTEFSYTATYLNESKPVESRSDQFHNSKLEASCGVCHEGLPSASDGKSMKADCAICHKGKINASVPHPPAEMKECASCHSWSPEKKVVVVEKGIPTACFDCHEDKKDQVENSEFPHPVAGECLTCHSSHGTDAKHLVRTDVYALCTSCHEEQKLNHPVGRHPLRFAIMRNGEEISCVACHNPHGSKHQKLFKTASGTMDMCSECH